MIARRLLAALAGVTLTAAASAVAALERITVTTPDGLAIAAFAAGPRGAPAILFIHGFAQSHASWLAQLEGPLAERFRMVAYDLRGHGDSAKPLEPRYYREDARWADEVRAVIEQTGLERPVLVGWSYAGRTIVDYLARHGDAGIAGINFVGAIANGALNAGAPAGRAIGGMLSADPAASLAATRDFLRQCFATPPAPADFERMVAVNMKVPREVRQALVNRPGAIEPVLKGIRVPVLVTQGEVDRAVLPAVARYIVATVPGARGSFYANVGHAPFHEAAERFNRELAAFVIEAARRR